MGLPMAYNLLARRLRFDGSQPESGEGTRDRGRRRHGGYVCRRSYGHLRDCAGLSARCDHVQNGIPRRRRRLANARPGQIIVDHSTVGAATSKACAAAAESRGAMFLDAPISGGTERAIDGTLTIMVGGPKAAYEKALPAFDIMARSSATSGRPAVGQLPSWSINCWWASTWLPPLKRCCWEQNRAPTRRWYSNWSTQLGTELCAGPQRSRHAG